jgi:hypothetical protein
LGSEIAGFTPTQLKNLLKVEDSPSSSCETLKLWPQKQAEEERTEMSREPHRKKDLKSLPD